MGPLFQDFQSGLRVIRREPGFAVVAILTLGVGIACATTVFSWVDGVLLHPYPGTSRSEELAVLEMVTPAAPNGGMSISWQDYRDYRDRLQGFAGLAAYRQTALTLGEGETGKLAWGELVSGNYFSVLGVRAVAGRLFDLGSSGDTVGANPVVVISERLWRSQFRADPAIEGRTIRVNRQLLTIAGVAPDLFRGSSVVMLYDLWIPLSMGPVLGAMPEASFRERNSRGSISAVGRVRSGVSVQQVAEEAAALAKRLEADYPATNRGVGATVLESWRAHNGVNEYLRIPLQILLAISVLVLLIVCANVANLLLARSVGRQREFGIRLAIGASRGRVAAQVLRETLVLAAAGAGVGLLLLLWMQGALSAMVPNIGLPVGTSGDWNGRILGFTALLCLATTMLAGAAPAVLVFRANLHDVLKEGSRGGTGSVASGRLRGALVIGEIALATVGLTGAALFVQSFQNARSIDPGFRTERVLMGRFFLETAGYTGDQAAQFAERLRDRLRRQAGVEAVSYTDFVPLSTTAGPYGRVQPEGYTPAAGEVVAVNRAQVAPGYFGVMGIPLVEGREFTDQDDRAAEPVAIVNQTFARRYFDGRQAVGRRLQTGGRWYRVAGVARDSKYFHPGEKPSPHFYLALRQSEPALRELYFLVRTAGAGGHSLLRQAVAETDANAAAFFPVALEEYTQIATLGQKVAANLMGSFGLLCLLLAGVGIYSVMSYTVTQRIPEIGIRVAMGASPGRVVALITGQGLAMAAAGIAVGLALASAGGRVVANQLVGVGAGEPGSYVMAAVFMLLATVAATGVPAYRAAKTDPMTALRK